MKKIIYISLIGGFVYAAYKQIFPTTVEDLAKEVCECYQTAYSYKNPNKKLQKLNYCRILLVDNRNLISLMGIDNDWDPTKTDKEESFFNNYLDNCISSKEKENSENYDSHQDNSIQFNNSIIEDSSSRIDNIHEMKLIQGNNLTKFAGKYDINLFANIKSESDLSEVFGKESFEKVYSHGSEEYTFVLFEETKNEAIIIFRQNNTLIKIKHDQSNWIQGSKVKPGISLLNLEKLNNDNITFWGFEWEESGVILSFHSGQLQRKNTPAISGKLILQNDIEKKLEEELNSTIYGDVEISSNSISNENIKSQIILNELIYIFNH